MPPPPPAKKRRKTAAGSLPVDTHRTTRSQRPGLNIEMIGKVAAFAQYGDDLMNICLAVGPKESAVIRYTCLRNSMEFLRYTVKQFATELADSSSTKPFLKIRANCDAWMAVNPAWRKHCTAERTGDEELSSAAHENGEGRVVLSTTNPLVLLNNPVVAIELGLVDVLKHLVEEIGIDINSTRWNGFTFTHRIHLLVAAFTVGGEERTACFDCLISKAGLDAYSKFAEGRTDGLWGLGFCQDCPPWVFRAIITHESFDPNKSVLIYGRGMLPLSFGLMSVMSQFLRNDEMTDDVVAKLTKFKILLEEGADPEFQDEDGFPSPLDGLKNMLSHESGTALDVGRRMLAMMEGKIAEE